MALTRKSPPYLFLKERVSPGLAPVDAAYLFARDDGSGNTKVSYQLHTGSIVDIGPSGPVTTGGLPEFFNVVRDFGATGNGSTNDAAAINGAVTAANASAGGGIVYFPKPSSGYKVNTQITVPAGVHMMGTRLTGEGNYCRVFAGAAMASVFSMSGSSSASNLTVDGVNLAQTTVSVPGDAVGLSHLHVRGGTNFTLANLAGVNRERWDHIRCSGDGIPSVAVFQIWSTDHLIDSIYADGPGTGARVFMVEGNTGMFSNLIGFGTSTSKEVLCIGETGAGSQNAFSSCYFSTCGSSADALISIRGGRNMFCGTTTAGAPGGKAPIGIRSAEGCQFFGFSYSDSGAASTRIAFFMDSGGVANSTPGNFNGTRIYWASDNTLTSGGAYHNLSGVGAGDGIDIVGYSTGGSVGTTNVRT